MKNFLIFLTENRGHKIILYNIVKFIQKFGCDHNMSG